MEQQKAFQLFHRAVADVPAYTSFLRQKRFDPKHVVSPADLILVPPTSKKNYLQKYKLEKMLWNGSLEGQLAFCATSGSTGAPFYFPRSEQLAQQYADFLVEFLQYGARRNGKPALVVLGFGMGIWIGGVITMRAFEIAAARINYPLSILPTGVNKPEIIKAFKQLAPNFGHTIFVGYPPFVKEVLSEAEREGIDVKKLKLRFLFAAESFNELFRDYVIDKAGIKSPELDTLNIYGTADIGAMAHETPLSILIRRLASQRREVFEGLFAQIHKTPTLAQYNPKYMHFEAVDGNILLTGDSAMPLIRYAVGDRGGVIGFDEMIKTLSSFGVDIEKEAKKAKISDTIHPHPFVYVYERVDFSVSLHGITIYPEFIKDSLNDKVLHRVLTGRFSMSIAYDTDQHQYLTINLESQPDAKLSAKEQMNIQRKVITGLQDRSSEFRELSQQLGPARLLHLVFWPHEHPEYFKPGIKQRWTQKS